MYPALKVFVCGPLAVWSEAGVPFRAIELLKVTAPMVPVGALNVPVKFVTAGAVKVLLVKVSVVAFPINVSVEAGRVTVTSAVACGPLRVQEFVPLSVSSLNNTVPAALALPVITGAVNDLFVNVTVLVDVISPAPIASQSVAS